MQFVVIIKFSSLVRSPHGHSIEFFQASRPCLHDQTRGTCQRLYVLFIAPLSSWTKVPGLEM